MTPLFGESGARGKRDVLEGRLITVALVVLRLGTHVVLDFQHQVSGPVGEACGHAITGAPAASPGGPAPLPILRWIGPRQRGTNGL